MAMPTSQIRLRQLFVDDLTNAYTFKKASVLVEKKLG